MFKVYGYLIGSKSERTFEIAEGIEFEEALQAAESAFDYWSSDPFFQRIAKEAYSRLEKFEEEDSAIPPSRDLVNFRIDRRKGNGGIL